MDIRRDVMGYATTYASDVAAMRTATREAWAMRGLIVTTAAISLRINQGVTYAMGRAVGRQATTSAATHARAVPNCVSITGAATDAKM